MPNNNQDASMPPSSSDISNNTSTTLPSSSSLVDLIEGKYYPSGTHHNISNIKSIPSGYQCIDEGSATVLYANDTEAFYNKVQVFNRDVSTLVIKMFNETRKEEKSKPPTGRRKKKEVSSSTEMDTSSDNVKPYEGLKILEALSATGLRSIRYWHEIPDVKQIIANDLLPEAVQVIKRNVEFNDISENCVTANQGDAIAYMASNSGKAFDVVDLDPYGSAAPFIDGAVQCVDGNGGLLCITCTDMAVLCGQQPGTCFAKYGAYPQKLKACHEQGLRMLISSIQTSASRYKRYVVPLLSLSVDFYVRVFLRVYTSPEKVKNIYKEMGNVYVCSGCEAFFTETFGGGSSANSKQFHEHGTKATIPKETCPECGWRLKLSGPMWLGPLHDTEFIAKCLDHVQKNSQLFSTHKRIIGLLTVAKSELPDAPLYHAVDHISSVLKCMNPPMTSVKSALINAGYRVSQSHAKPNALKTDAPIGFIYDVMKEWIKTNPVKPQKEDSKKTPGQAILEKPQHHTDINFTVNEKALTTRKYTGIATFLPNPEENWGPGKRNTIHQSVKSSNVSSENTRDQDTADHLSSEATTQQPQTKKPKRD
ncbi:hypothetical protein FDP41_012922 [Naegleria fowleri]|uniref:tRNA (guanine(26)-N(2))-dimethyltransferase n=1 Tax=Naegleria fowleri TaxID=5763 RepID=A0A6A5C3R0_NAEFO|nr:uncharacterized protein FDP41_012922 [Naegleria fowleri]KAF0981134.1 hypothetical protein FDP41_012922 [Naegleria fowleri]